MSKREASKETTKQAVRQPQTIRQQVTPVADRLVPDPVADARPLLPVVRDSSGRKVEPERFCPLCWSANQGYGTTERTMPDGKRYYKCQHTLRTDELATPCGWTWTMTREQIEEAKRRYEDELRALIVEHRDVKLQTR